MMVVSCLAGGERAKDSARVWKWFGIFQDRVKRQRRPAMKGDGGRRDATRTLSEACLTSRWKWRGRERWGEREGLLLRKRQCQNRTACSHRRQRLFHFIYIVLDSQEFWEIMLLVIHAVGNAIDVPLSLLFPWSYHPCRATTRKRGTSKVLAVCWRVEFTWRSKEILVQEQFTLCHKVSFKQYCRSRFFKNLSFLEENYLLLLLQEDNFFTPLRNTDNWTMHVDDYLTKIL